MAFLLVGLGLGIIAIAVFDVFETLLDPEDQGRLTNLIGWTVWRCCRLGPVSLLVYAGPLAYTSVLGGWTLMVVTGGAFIYWPYLGDAFLFDSSLDPEQRSGFLTAFYLSFVTFATLGYGDITPTAGWLRVLGPAQSLIGFFLLSAAITWILAIYQDIGTRRTLAHETTLLMESLDERRMELNDLQSSSVEQMIGQLTTRLVNVTGSLNQFPITYFFRITDERQSLAVMALFLCELTEDLRHEHVPKEVRLQAHMLARALDHFAEELRGRFVDVEPNATTRDVLEAYARDHRRTIAR